MSIKPEVLRLLELRADLRRRFTPEITIDVEIREDSDEDYLRNVLVVQGNLGSKGIAREVCNTLESDISAEISKHIRDIDRVKLYVIENILSYVFELSNCGVSDIEVAERG
jgi:hypothetical protein